MTKKLLFFMLLSLPLNAQWAKPEIRLPEIELGKKTAPIEILFYYSFSCLHCAQFHKESLDKLKKKYIDTGKARLVLRDVALDQISYFASTYAHMLPEKDYLKIFELGMSKQREWLGKKDMKTAFLRLAGLSGLPVFPQDQIMKNDEVSDKILKRWQEAKKKYFLEGTPAFIINGKIYNHGMSWGEFEDKLKLACKALGKTTQ